MRMVVILLLGVLLTACGQDGVVREQTPAVPIPVKVKTPPKPPTEEELVDFIREDYEIIVQDLEAELLTLDSIAYECDEVEGQVLMYTDQEEGLRLAINSYSDGGHSGATEYWYFRDDAPIFMLRESGYWTFGGPPPEESDDSEFPTTHSIDYVTEDRYYFADGKLIRQLEKKYELHSWEKTPGAENTPNEKVTHNGEIPVTYAWMAVVVKEKVVDCDKVVVEW